MIKERGRLLTAVLLGAWCLVFAVQAGAQTGGPHLFVFNMGSEDVTIIDPATNQVVGTRPVGFKVKWLADHMQSFDGTLLWTYGLRTEKIGAAEVLKVDAIAFDPATGQVTHRLAVGKFPCDLHLSPDGRLAYFPERDQDTVSALNVTARQVVNRVNFPKGSKPHMLRASPDGKYVWVQNAVANTNEILDGHT